MLRNFFHFVVAATLLLLPTGLRAGGPPFLCLPVDGLTSEDVPACTERLNAKLEKQLWAHPGRPTGVKFSQRASQWHLAFYMGSGVRLSEVQAALENSRITIPLDRLRLFGHVILEIDADSAAHQNILTALGSLPHASVEESKTQENLLLVTVDFPYPVDQERSVPESVGWEKFQRNGLNSNPSANPRTPATLRELPSYETIRDLVAKQKGSLREIRWSANYACRALGGVAEPVAFVQKDASPSSPVEESLVGKWQVEFANGVSQICEIGKSGETTVVEPQRKSRGKGVVQGASIVITFDDDRVERWTPVGKRQVVEHWFPGLQFPAATPVLGIAERGP